MTTIKEIICTTALNRIRRKMPYSWDLNIYRGCEHGCKYCYALYSHNYLGDDSYFSTVYVKTNILETLERQLSSPSWRREVVNIGGVTDSYQPLEAEYKLMPEILRLMIKYKTPCIISTKSDLILRDFDLIAELAEITYINVASTIVTTDEKLSSLLEPNGAHFNRRFSILKAFSATKASVGLHMMPIIPFLTDNKANLNTIFELARESGVDYLLPGLLYLRGQTRGFFLDFAKENFPELYPEFIKLYGSGWGADSSYKKSLYQLVSQLQLKYGVTSNYSTLMNSQLVSSASRQLSLFD
ncbi:MAG: hypothetical protein JXR63_02235 [Spirochaetales bacterium]|nr:hypothetical protein [Spirochaetales bacterium]